MTGSQRVYLHVGAPKTGTTYLQEVLWHNRETLRSGGVSYPGDRPDAQFQATLDLLDRTYHKEPAAAGSWDRLAAQVRDWPGTSVISHELLAGAGATAVRRAVDSLDGVELHIVCTARDLARQVPAVWQEDVKNRGRLSFGEFSRSLQGPDDTVDPYFADTFWTHQDLPVVLRKWAVDVPPGRVHVVTLPRGGPRDALWSRFAEVVGIDPAHAPVEVDVRNPSMGVVETNLVRLLNGTSIAGDLDWAGFNSLVKNFLAVDVLAARPGSVPLGLPAEDRAWVERRSKDAVEAVRQAGYHVVGDLADLLPAEPAGDPGHPDDARDADLLDAALYALAGTLRRFDEERRQFDEDRRRFAEEPPGLRRALVGRYGRDPRVGWALRRYRQARTWLRRDSRAG